MSETSHAHQVHAAPTGFIWKYIFSLDHKIIGLQYYFLALIAVFSGNGAFDYLSPAAGLADRALATAGENVSRRL